MNGQAKIDFEKWLFKEGNKLIKDTDRDYDLYYLYKYMLPIDLKNTIIIKWFDSVGIYIETGGADYRGVEFWYNIQEKNTINGHNGEYFTSRQQATEKALEQAIILYNEKFKENE